MNNRGLNLAIMTALLAVTIWAYWGVRSSPFHFDDVLFLQSPQVTSPGDPWYLLKPSQSRQLTYLSFYGNYRLCGTNPAGYHLINLSLHCLNVIGVYIFALLLFRLKPTPEPATFSRWLPVASAGIFALHPIQSEAVNYIYQRSVLLATLFSLAAIVTFLLFAGGKRSTASGLLAAAFTVLACLSKETALALPLLLAALAWICSPGAAGPRQVLHRMRYLLPPLLLLMLTGSAWVLFSLYQKGDRTVGLGLARQSLHYMGSQVQVIATYIRMLFWPGGLVIDHAFQPAPPLSMYALLCWILLSTLLVAFLMIRRINPQVSFLGLAFFILLIPNSSIIPSADLMFEHRLYLPMIAGSILLAWLLFRVCHFFVRRDTAREATSLVLLTLVLAASASAAKQRTFVWGDNIRLWSDAVAKVPLNARAHYNLGVAYLVTDRRKARQEFERTIALQPKHAAALYNLGWLEQAGGNLDAARRLYHMAIQADDGYWQAHFNLANVGVLQGRFTEAIREYNQAIRLHTELWQAFQSLASVQIQVGDTGAALETLQKLIQHQPDMLEARYLRAYALIKESRTGEAETEIGFIISRDKKGEYAQAVRELRQFLTPASGTNGPH